MPAVWEPNPAGAAQDYSSSGGGDYFVGVGSPTISGSDGDVYLDTGSGSFYEMVGGAWVLRVVFATGGGDITSSASNPEGSVTATPGKLHYNTATKTVWIKDSGTGNTGWVELQTIAP